MRINLKAITSAHLFAFLVLSSNAATIRVPADQLTIQQAIDAASNGDTVLVSPGTYLERINYLGKAITVQGAGLPEETIIDGGNVGPVVTMQSSEGRQSILTKVTIQHGLESFGAGMILTGASPTVSGNVFRDNSQGGGGFGAAIGGNGSSPLIVGNLFHSNSCDTQFLSGVLGFVNNSSPLIYNNILRDNPCRAINLTLPSDNTPVIANNTILANAVGVHLSAVGNTTFLVSNNIVQGNDVGLEYQGGSLIWRNNDVFLNTTNYSGIADQTGMNGNISADPLLVAGPWPRPTVNSPVIDAGSLSGLSGLPATDFDGRPRVVDGDGNGSVLVDMGAYEYNQPVVPATYSPLSPSRVWDTRSGPGPTGQVGVGQTRNVTVTGVGGVPTNGVTAVVLNITAINPSAQTFSTVWPTGESRPLAANLNVPPGDVRANLVIVKVGTGGQVSVFNNSGNVDFVADVAGWYGPEVAGRNDGQTFGERYTSLLPARIWDTRFGPAPVGVIEAGGSRAVTVTGVGGVPATGVSAVVLNLTAISPSARTFITAWPTGETRPLAANLNAPAGDVRANLVIVKVGAAGQVSFYNNSGNVNMVADVAGYFSTTGSSFNSVSPNRIWDSRSGPGPTGKLGPGGSKNITVTGVGGVPVTGVTAVVLSVTAVKPSAKTFVTAWPAGEARPLAANLNAPANDVRANLVTVKVGAGDQVSFFNNAGNVDLVADVAGWYGPPGQ